MNSPTSPAFPAPETLLFTFFFAPMDASQRRGHLIKALLQAGFRKAEPLLRRIAVFRDGHFCFVVAHGFEGYDITHILWEIRRQANLYRVSFLSVLVGQVMDVFDHLHRRNFPISPRAV